MSGNRYGELNAAWARELGLIARDPGTLAAEYPMLDAELDEAWARLAPLYGVTDEAGGGEA